jgi:hypothetical protein
LRVNVEKVFSNFCKIMLCHISKTIQILNGYSLIFRKALNR